jgi:hypothetical protein
MMKRTGWLRGSGAKEFMAAVSSRPSRPLECQMTAIASLQVEICLSLKKMKRSK